MVVNAKILAGNVRSHMTKRRNKQKKTPNVNPNCHCIRKQFFINVILIFNVHVTMQLQERVRKDPWYHNVTFF